MANKIKEETKIKIGLIKLGYNRPTIKFLTEPEGILKLKTKTIGEGMATGKVQSPHFLPVYFYPEGVERKHNELGCDREYRYILKVSKN